MRCRISILATIFLLDWQAYGNTLSQEIEMSNGNHTMSFETAKANLTEILESEEYLQQVATMLFEQTLLQ